LECQPILLPFFASSGKWVVDGRLVPSYTPGRLEVVLVVWSKEDLVVSIRLLAVLTVFAGLMVFGWAATAQEEHEGETDVATVVGADTLGDGNLGTHEAERGKFVAIAIGFGLGLAAACGALAQGRATSAAMEGLSRNPGSYDRVFTPFILGMVLMESLVIYSLVISLILLGSLGG